MRFSIITVSLDAEDTIAHCIESVMNQPVETEHIVIDGQSADKTLDITDRYSAHLAKVISEPDQGLYDAMNKGLKLATGDIIGLLNADDFYPTGEVLSRVLQAFEDPSIDACYGDLVYVDRTDINRNIRYWRAGFPDPGKFYHGWMPPHPTFFVRRVLYEQYGLFRTELGTAADYELMLRFLLKYKIKTAYIPQTLVHMRTGGVSNINIKNRILANRMDRKAWEVNDITPYPWTLIAKPIRKLGQWL